MMILSLMLLMIFCFPKDLIESRLKDFEKSDYLYEYRDYYISLDRTRALKSQNDTMSFELEKEASKYRTTINKAIERTTLRRLVPSYLTSSRRSI